MMTVDDVLRNPQLTKASQLWLRFYGRFVFVRSDPDVIVLAVNTCPSGHTADDHKVFVSIREMNVRDTNITASSRVIGTEVAPFEGALNVWSIDKCDIEVSGNGGVTWPGSTNDLIPLADLKVLARTGKVNPMLLEKSQFPPSQSLVTARIRIHEGSEFSFHLPLGGFTYQFVTLNQPREVFEGGPYPLADMVQVTRRLPREGVHLTVDSWPSSAAGSDGTRTITVDPLFEPIVVVSFSNLCSGGNEVDFTDAEFAAFYEVLLERPQPLYVPKLANVSVHWPQPGESRKSTPFTESRRESMLPFGDCFLGAMISA
jgi:hypothetical protein